MASFSHHFALSLTFTPTTRTVMISLNHPLNFSTSSPLPRGCVPATELRVYVIIFYGSVDVDRLFNEFDFARGMAIPTVSMELHTSCDSDVELGKRQG